MHSLSYLAAIALASVLCSAGCAPIGCTDGVEFLADFNAESEQDLSLKLCLEQKCSTTGLATPSIEEDFTTARFEGNDVVVRRLVSEAPVERFSLLIDVEGRDLLLDADDGDVLTVEVKDSETGAVVFSHQEALDLRESGGCKGGGVHVAQAEGAP